MNLMLQPRKKEVEKMAWQGVTIKSLLAEKDDKYEQKLVIIHFYTCDVALPTNMCIGTIIFG